MGEETDDGFDAEQRRSGRLGRQRGISRSVTVEDGQDRQQIQVDVQEFPIRQVVLKKMGQGGEWIRGVKAWWKGIIPHGVS